MPASLSNPTRRELPSWARGLKLARLADLEERESDNGILAIGFAPLDEALGGGLVRGAVSEFCGAPGSLGLTLVQYQCLHAARQARLFSALIDGFDRFDPGGYPSCREGLLWLRCERGVPQALKAADLLVRDPNFGLLLLDLREAEARALRRVPTQQWYRLQRAVRENEASLLVFTPFPLVASATTRLRFLAPPRKHHAPPADLHLPAQLAALRWEILRSRREPLLTSTAATA